MGAEASVALVAGGGAVKAYAFHLGVLRGLVEDGFHFRGGLRWDARSAPAGAREIDCYVGSSAGACIVSSLASGRPAEELYRALLGTSKIVPKFGYRTLFVPVAPKPVNFVRRAVRRFQLGDAWPHQLLDPGGVFTASGVERYFRRHVLPTNRFADLAPKLFLVSTQVNNSRKVIFGPADSLTDSGYDPNCAYYDNIVISQALAAAVSVPPVFAPYGIVNPASGKLFHYYDGEVREPLSLHIARDAGAKFVISSSIWSPYSFDDSVGSLADWGMSVLTEQALHQMIQQKVQRDREQSEQFDRLLELLDEHGAEHGIGEAATERLKERVRSLLRHRTVRSLHVTPVLSDSEFLFHGAFRFSRRLIDRCVDAGYRGYRLAVEDNPEFLPALDQAMAAPAADP